ncbi:hypothetical protein GCK72_008502 [Caenorhabditis remanei]|uniref:Uncharacterized protein n=1 Tax=Caenorhabditis remanei TaxID=31234 RepID=A0A6A5H0G2_CAERE|nr:hypothetical protein GCK72_008502 [Caenorhabditis remanei]KAF1760256.1 hypothetical protein GCK72_008502 [Caenorhabditis remanei]
MLNINKNHVFDAQKFISIVIISQSITNESACSISADVAANEVITICGDFAATDFSNLLRVLSVSIVLATSFSGMGVLADALSVVADFTGGTTVHVAAAETIGVDVGGEEGEEKDLEGFSY